jgi:adenine-specific DNA-methyltransferase
MDGKSLSITEDKLAQLKQLFPEVFAEDKVDFDKLKLILGEETLAKEERYELNWAGKYDSFKEIQKQTTATLIPDPENSIDFDTSENIFIEGENLEALRVLQKSYYGKIKMIYIDPPYNTGNDSFVYPDDYTERRSEYEERTGIKDEDGFLNKQDLWKKNTKENGQFHSVWLSMMYPRLFLARNLMCEDGVIFVSIDDNEVTNIRLLMDSVFGKENFVGTIIWKNATDNNPTQIAIEHEYILVFAKNKDSIESEWKSELSDVKQKLISIGNELIKKHDSPQELQAVYSQWLKQNKAYLSPLDRYKYIDTGGVYTGSQSVHNPGKEGYRYDIIHPITGKACKEPLMGYRFPKQTMDRLLEDGKILFGEDEHKIVELKVYAKDYKEKLSSLFSLDGRLGAYDIKTVFPNSTRIFNNPKPLKLINHFTSFILKDNDIILDFFSGSASTAHAILKLNQEDNGNRKFICVQMPEPTPENSEAKKAGYETISQISQARIKKVIEQLKAEKEGKLDFDKDNPQDLGFKSFKLAPSNFKTWRSDAEGEALEQQLALFKSPYKEGTEQENMLYELLLKAGFPLTVPIQKESVKGVALYIVDGGKMLLALEAINEKVLEYVLKVKPQRFVTLDKLFGKDDQLLTNTRLQLQEMGVDFQVI